MQFITKVIYQFWHRYVHSVQGNIKLYKYLSKLIQILLDFTV